MLTAPEFFRPEKRNMQAKRFFGTTLIAAKGLGCFYAWFLLTQFMLILSIRGQMFLFVNRLVLDVALLALLAFALFFSRLIYPMHKRFQPPFLPLACVGIFFIAYNDMLGPAGKVLCLFGVICAAVEYGWLTLLWVEFFSLLDARRCAHTLGLSVVVATIIIAASSLLPYIGFTVIVALLPVFSTIALAIDYWHSERSDETFRIRLRRFDRPLPQFSLKVLRREPGTLKLVRNAVISFSVYGFIYSFTSTYLIYSQSSASTEKVMGFVCAGLLLLVALYFSRKYLRLSYLYWALPPLLTVGLLLITIQPAWGATSVILAYTLALLLCTLTICEIGRRFETSCLAVGAFVFGVGTALCCVGIFAGYLCFLLLPPTPDSVYLTYISWVLIIGLAAYTTISSANGGFAFNIKLDAAHKERHLVAEEPPDPHDIEISKTVYYEALDQRCRALGKRYGLTIREVEVLTLIAQSYPTARIASQLNLAQSTVKVHTHNIFEKTDIHKRIDLLDIIHNDS
jgi:DNA-binding CsgD family transcriptional regulator